MGWGFSCFGGRWGACRVREWDGSVCRRLRTNRGLRVSACIQGNPAIAWMSIALFWGCGVRLVCGAIAQLEKRRSGVAVAGLPVYLGVMTQFWMVDSGCMRNTAGYTGVRLRPR